MNKNVIIKRPFAIFGTMKPVKYVAKNIRHQRPRNVKTVSEEKERIIEKEGKCNDDNPLGSVQFTGLKQVSGNLYNFFGANLTIL